MKTITLNSTDGTIDLDGVQHSPLLCDAYADGDRLSLKDGCEFLIYLLPETVVQYINDSGTHTGTAQAIATAINEFKTLHLGGGALNIATLLGEISDNGNVIASQDGDAVRLDMNWNGVWTNPNDIPNVPAATATKGDIAAVRAYLIDLINGVVGSGDPSTVSGMIAWWAGDDAGLSGVTAPTWPDKSGNGYTLTAPSGQEPGYDSTNNCLTFSGAQSMSTATIPFSTTKDLTVFVVMKNLTIGLGIFMESSADLNSNADTWILDVNENTQGHILAGSRGNTGTDSSEKNASATDPVLFRADIWRSNAGGDTLVSVNGDNTGNTKFMTNDNSSNFSDQSLYLGARGNSSFFFTGKIYEVIIYDSALTDGDVTKIEDYLTTKYSL